MNKTITALLIASLTLPAAAEETATGRIIPSEVIVSVSPDGTYATSEMNGSVTILNLDTDEHYDYLGDDRKYYGQGVGNCWSLNQLVGWTDMEGTSAVWRGGRWISLPLSQPDPAGMGSANGITPSGSRICGNASTGSGLVLDEPLMMVYPCYWDQLPNKNYSKQTSLPYPTTDFVGEVPQYVTAVSIADDGKKIFGQLTSNNGMMHELVIYTQVDDSTWTYAKPLSRLINPNHIEVPENPGDGPERPSEENFMTADQLAEYDAACAKWRENPYTDPYPQYATFMTEEQIAQFDEAMKPYDEWEEKSNLYLNTVSKIMDESIDFCFNLVRVSPNGRYVAMAAQKSYYVEVGSPAITFYTPYLYDTLTDSITEIAYPGASCLITAVNDEGTVLGYRQAGDTELGMVRTPGSTEWITLGKYLIQRDPGFAKWIEDNWMHEVEVVLDEETGETDFQNLEITGVPFVSADWNTFASYAYNFWGGDTKGYYISYVVTLSDSQDSIDTIAAAPSPDAAFNLKGQPIRPLAPGLHITPGKKQLVK